MEPMSRNRQIATTIIVLVLLIGGLVWSLWQLGLVRACMATLSC